MWNLFGTKKEQKAINPRIDVEDMAEQGYSCKEIAAEMGMTEEEVYRIKNAKLRRVSRMQTGRMEEDRIAGLREELIAVELQGKIDEAKHKEFLRRQEREEYENDEEDVPDEKESPESLLVDLLRSAAKKQQSPQESPANASQPINPAAYNPDVQKASVPVTAVLDFAKVEAAIKAGLLSEKQFIEEAAALKLSAEKAKKLYSFIKGKL